MTKGKWKWTNEDGHNRFMGLIDSETKEYVLSASPSIEYDDIIFIEKDEHKDLIASAPEMLGLLKIVNEGLCYYIKGKCECEHSDKEEDGTQCPLCFYSKVILEADSLLSKIKGGE